MRVIPASLGLVAVVLVLTASGCGNSTASVQSTPAPTITVTATPTSSATISLAKAAATAYLAVATKLNRALGALSKTAAAWPSSETGAQAEKSAQPAIAALEAGTAKLTEYRWPSDVVSDAHALIGAVGSLTGDLESLSSVNLLSASSWASQFTRDAQTVKTDAALVRHDLGLKAAK